MKAFLFLIAIPASLLLIGCSKETASAPSPSDSKVQNLGVVELTNQVPTRRDLGDGKACTITPTLFPDGTVELAIVVEVSDPTASRRRIATPTIRTFPGKPVEIAVGETAIALTPKLNPE